MTIFSLIDCNNFYVSCERAFNPALEKKPVVVLSNNDGCVISRSSEAKQLGIPMGAPYYKWQGFCKNKNVQVFSSNYELYGDMSTRVMNILKEHYPRVEVYSIDEAFLLLEQEESINLIEWMRSLRHKIKQYTGIPVSIGIGQTKTLAKIANRIAKTTVTENIYHLATHNNLLLTQVPIAKVWGIGSETAKKMERLNIHTAQALYESDPNRIRMHFNVTIERIVHELQGTPCIPLTANMQPRQQIVTSRSFGKQLTKLEDLQEAISHYAALACAKLRKQHCVAGGISIFLETNFFNKKLPYYGNSLFYPFPTPTMDTRQIISIAKKSLQQLFKPEYQYHKAGVILTNLVPGTLQQYDMLNTNANNEIALMHTVDTINKKMGKDVVFYAAEGIARDWKMQANKLSPRYTTCWAELLAIDVNK